MGFALDEEGSGIVQYSVMRQFLEGGIESG